jgi:cell division septal protein FtsQ
MTRRRLALGVLATAVVATGIWLAPRGLRRLAIFDVRRVEIVGTRFLESSHLITVLGLAPGANIFDPTEPLERRLFAVRGVARVTVHRRIPGTLVLDIQERPPVALARTDDRLVLVDREGRALPYDPAGVDVDLPVADADSAVLGVVERVRETDPELFAKVVAAVREPHAVVLETPGQRLLLSLEATPREIEDLGLVLDEAARRGLKATEFDARFAGRVIVRGGRSS